jgi:solute carrier family 25 (peroxisomal adenine nucleotide transporter), member 17
MTSPLPPLTQALTGALGSASASALTYPLDLLAARVQTQKPRDVRKTGKGLQGIVALMRHIVEKHGLKALYLGLQSDVGATFISK